MFDKVSKLLGLKADHSKSEADGLALATAALLVQVSKADGDFSAQERAALVACLKDQFSLDDGAASELIERAELDQADATCLYAFTRTIARELDQDARQDILRLLWRVALADSHIDNFEENVLAKVAGLLGISPQDRIRIKHEVEAG